ncbi:MAG TPA: hypothetical protein DEF47_18110 [Herpetosiphon sp.]|uniref:hypothetical protein n=1 Tax=Herpetosiphon sp. TaxID=71864 RepID=UPI00059ED722|nr:hypothetical protein [Herpetosiphon sp.]HBW51810.1 hypothetical protein [Herpetosiphon sp.]
MEWQNLTIQILFMILGLLSFLYMIIGLYKWVVSGGNRYNIYESINIISDSIIILIIVISSIILGYILKMEFNQEWAIMISLLFMIFMIYLYKKRIIYLYKFDYKKDDEGNGDIYE